MADLSRTRHLPPEASGRTRRARPRTTTRPAWARQWQVTMLYPPRPEHVMRDLMSRTRDLVVADGAWGQVERDSQGLAWALVGDAEGSVVTLARQHRDGRLAQVPRGRKEGTLPDGLSVGKAHLPGVVEAGGWMGEMAVLADPDHLRQARKAGLGDLVPLLPESDMLPLPAGVGAAIVGVLDQGWGTTLAERLEKAGRDRPLILRSGSTGYQLRPETVAVGMDRFEDISVSGLLRAGAATWASRASGFTILPVLLQRLEERETTRVVRQVVHVPAASRREDLSGQVAALRDRLEREKAETARLRKANQALAHAVPRPEQADEEPSQAEQAPDTERPCLPAPVTPPHLDSLAGVLEWAGALSHVHIEDGADQTENLDRMSDRVGVWACQLADGLALVDGWARALADGGRLSPYAYARAVGANPRAVCMKESRQVMDTPAWRRARVRECCREADPSGSHLFAAHLRMGGKGAASPRAHFDLGSDGRVHVGYVGPHLPNSVTMNRQMGAWR